MAVSFCTLLVLITLFACVSHLVLLHKSERSSQNRVMDTFFISHGSPMLSIDDSLPARHFLKSWQKKIFTPRPKSILLKYPAPGAPHLAKRVKELLTEAGFKHVMEDNARGLDHGAWVPLMLMYPEADIPICQLSIQTNQDGTYHYKMGKALAPLRDEGVLIIGSGSATHNLRALQFNDVSAVPWALNFDTWLKESLINGRHEDVNHYMVKAPRAEMAHPRPDHLYPLHVALGATGENADAELIPHSWSMGSLSYASYRFSTAW